MINIKKYILEITVFACGAVVMIFEIVGSRVLGPYFGNSIFVWTSLIGIVLGGLSLGYYFGGKISDKEANRNTLSLVIVSAGVAIGLTSIIKHPLLSLLQESFLGDKISLLTGSVILFLPAAILLGMVSPYAAKLKLDSLKNSGSTVGNLYALSTMGSIIGTFLAGFYLIPSFGTTNLLLVIAIILITNSFFLSKKNFFKTKIAILIIFGFSIFAVSSLRSIAANNGFIDVDTMYNRFLIYDYENPNLDREVRVMKTDSGNQSAMFLDSNDLAIEYTKYYDLANFFNPNPKKTLMLGGGGYSYPKYFLEKYPEATMDIVEIDPGTTDLARKYFNLKDDPRLKIYHKDGRVFLNQTNNKYDAIFGDAFSSSSSIPYQLTTREAVQKKYDILNRDGVVVLNIISAMEGDGGQFLRAEYKTFKNVFPQVYLFPVNYPDDKDKIQNVILVALKSKREVDFISQNPQISEYLGHLWKEDIANDMPILTDEHAPVDYYISKML